MFTVQWLKCMCIITAVSYSTENGYTYRCKHSASSNCLSGSWLYLPISSQGGSKYGAKENEALMYTFHEFSFFYQTYRERFVPKSHFLVIFTQPSHPLFFSLIPVPLGRILIDAMSSTATIAGEWRVVYFYFCLCSYFLHSPEIV